MKKVISLLLALILTISAFPGLSVYSEEDTAALDITAKSVVLMEPYSGKIIYEKNSHEKLRPASVTKIMTLILIFDAISQGKIKKDDIVTVSPFAASMGGSQVFLEASETQTVDTMIKCIAVASGNDASVAMAEHIAGSEAEFVKSMNERAKGLGMNDTNFVNCSGLDNDLHLTSAYDVALMSRELVTKYPEIHNYSTIWMDTIIHKTKRGDIEFGLTNTNKLIKWYNDATGLKTGSTSLAKYSVSATAKRNNMELIAVVMAAPDYKVRFTEAMKMLDYGFANCSIYKDNVKDEIIKDVPIKKGVKETTNCIVNDDFTYVCTKSEKAADITKEVIVSEFLKAPITKGEKVGEVLYKLKGEVIGKTDILTTEDIKEASFKDYWTKVIKMFAK